MIVIVGHGLSVHRIEKGPGGLMVPAGSEDRLQRVVELVRVDLLVTVLCGPKYWSSFNGKSKL